MKHLLLPAAAALTAAVLPARAANLIANGDFEDVGGTFPNGWVTSTSAPLAETAAPLDGSASARFTANADRIIAQNFTAQSTFTIEFEVMPLFDTNDRSLNMIAHFGGTGTSGGFEAVNLKFAGSITAGAGADLQVFNGTGWVTLGAANFFANNSSYRIQLTGYNWGSGTPSYDLAWSNANSTALVNTATGLGYFQNTPNAGANRLRFLTATTGRNSYLLDNVIVEAVPEPSSLLLGGIGALFAFRRRRN
jgi:hypothetical protein